MARLLQTRQEVLRRWRALGDELVMQSQIELAQAVRRFAAQMPPAQTEKEWIRDRLSEGQRVRDGYAPSQ
jgi:hypothetical protein